jgi:hypothetical protein
MAFRKFLRFWPFRPHHDDPISASNAQAVDPDLIEVPSDEAGWEDYMRYRAARERQRNSPKDN